MKKALYLLAAIALFISCSTSLQEKAENLIRATEGDYKEKPTFTFKDELYPIIDKEINDLSGYTLVYTMIIGKDTFNREATFNKNVTLITDDNAYIIEEEKEIDTEVEEMVTDAF